MIALELNEVGSLDLLLKLYDRSDALQLSIERNEWVSGNPTPWDIQANYQCLTVRRRRGEVALKLDCRRSPLQLSVSLR